jgi:hypothetical protein
MSLDPRISDLGNDTHAPPVTELRIGRVLLHFRIPEAGLGP